MKKRVAVTKQAKTLLAIPPATELSSGGGYPDKAWRQVFKLEKPKRWLREKPHADQPNLDLSEIFEWEEIPEGSEEDRWNESQLAAIRRMFDHFGLDPNNPFAWRLLMEYVAFAFFWKEPKTRGAPTKWTQEKLAELTAVVATFPGMSNQALAKRLANDKKSRFYVKGTTASDGVRGLRQKIGKARKKLSRN